jgi:magnesium-protoporphyrin IX monomethyl ester (oxidative) cyclase
MKRKIQNILLIRPATTLPIGTKYQGVGEPLGILYIAAVLIKKGYDVSIFDASSIDLKRQRGNYITYGSDCSGIKDAIKNASADIVGVSCFATCSEFDLFETCKAVKEVDECIPVVVGGSHPSIFPERMLERKYIDYVVMHEGEYRFLSLIDALNKNESDFKFDGIAYRKSDKVKINQPKSWIEDLDGLPYPARDLIDMSRYAKLNEKYGGTLPFKKSLVLATRGCFNSCSYCLVHKFWGRRIRRRLVVNIIGEVRILKENYGFEDIFFVDDNLCGSKIFVKELFGKLKKMRVRWEVPLGVYPPILDKEIIRLMFESGAHKIKLAIESGSKRVLKNIMHRDIDPEKIKEIVNECHKYGMQVYGSFVLGMIGETKQEIFQTLNFPNKVRLDGANFQVAVPFPGTNFYNEALVKGYLPKQYNFRNLVMSDSSILKIPESSPEFAISPEELRDLIARKEKDFTKILKLNKNK